MSDSIFTVLFIFFYLVPFFAFSLNKWINGEMNVLGLNIKTIDLITPYLIFCVHLYSSLAFGFSLFPYFVIVISVIGILLAVFFVVKKKELFYKKFLRVWWRYVFLISFPTYSIVGAIALYNQFTM